MKKPFAVVLAVVSVLFSSGGVSAAGVEVYFDPALNKLVIPHLNFDNRVYYATLTLTNGATLSFQADLQQLVDVTRENVPSSVNMNASDIVGNWRETEGSTVIAQVSFNSNGTYTVNQMVSTASDCFVGAESGTYRWEPTTGVMSVQISSDSNGSCGFSDNGGAVVRIYVDGNVIRALEGAGSYAASETFLNRI